MLSCDLFNLHIMTNLFKHKKIIFTVFLVLDLLIFLLHFIYANKYNFFDLDMEQNLPTFYQSFKLLFESMLLFSIYLLISVDKKCSRGVKSFWLILVFIFSYLCIDEAAQIHENIFPTIKSLFPSVIDYPLIGSFSLLQGFHKLNWLVIYIPIIFIIIVLIVYFSIKIFKYYVREFIFFITGLLAMIIVPILEYIEIKFKSNGTLYQYIMTSEELLEMIGVSLIVLFSLEVLSNIYQKLSTTKRNKKPR